MANMVRVRVEVNPDERDKDTAFYKMFRHFKKVCQDAGIIRTLKEHQQYESKPRKRRRKAKESEVARMKAKLRENFLQTNNSKNKNNFNIDK